MTNKLQAQLRDIIAEAQGYIDDDEIKTAAMFTAIDHIHQAYMDAGYKLYSSKYVSEHERRQGGYMTGKEWYEIFNKELNTAIVDSDTNYYVSPDIDWIKEAAKKASGIEDIN